jgi:hypothetical protein
MRGSLVSLADDEQKLEYLCEAAEEEGFIF